jgi:hypothetical protein
VIHSLLVATALGGLPLCLQLDTMFQNMVPLINLIYFKQYQAIHNDGVESKERSCQLYLLGLSPLSQKHNTTTTHCLEKYLFSSSDVELRWKTKTVHFKNIVLL